MFKLGFHFFEQILFVGEGLASFGDKLLWCLRNVVRAVEALFERENLLIHLKDAIFEIVLVFLVDIFRNVEIDIVIMDGEMQTLGIFLLDLRHTRRFSEMLN